jgi:ribosomal protein S18 acetylase RimI-like enzyme
VTVNISSLIRPAEEPDLPALFELIDQANTYSLGMSPEPQWGLVDFARDQLRQLVRDGHCFVACDAEGRIVASVSVDDEDTYAWDERGTDGEAVYFHKLMRSPELAPKGTAVALLEYIERLARERGKRYIRADVKANQVRLLAYYLALGFINVGDINYPASGKPAVLIERAITS